MLEYYSLRSFMDYNAIASWDNLNSKGNTCWYSDGKTLKVDLYKIKDRLSELEKIIIAPYVIDNTEKSE